MTDIDRTLTAFLVDDSANRVAPHLDEVLALTSRTRQRAWWSSPGRWLPVELTMDRRAIPTRGFAWSVLLLILLIVALVGVSLVAAPRVPPPFGLARNGVMLISGDGDILRFDPLTHQATPLIGGPSYDFGPTFSKDGRHIAFGRFAKDPTFRPDVGMVIALADPDGSHVRELTTPVLGQDWSDWSPDSRTLLYMSRDTSGYAILNLLDIETGVSTVLDPGISVRSSMLGWRPPDGREIVFRGEQDDVHQVLAIRPDGTGKRVVSASCDCDDSAVSPDGRFMAITRWGPSGARLYLLDLDAGDERLVPIPPGHMSRGGAFSPDGRWIAYPLLHPVSDRQNAYQVALAPIDGSQPPRLLGPEKLLTPDGSDLAIVALTFSPDGSTILAGYSPPEGGDDDIWSLPVDGSPGTPVIQGRFGGADIQRLAP